MTEEAIAAGIDPAYTPTDTLMNDDGLAFALAYQLEEEHDED